MLNTEARSSRPYGACVVSASRECALVHVCQMDSRVTIVVCMTGKPIPLVGAHEIRDLLGGNLSRQRLYQITSGENFPKRLAKLSQGQVWAAEDVEKWIKERRPWLAAENGQ